MNERIKQLAEQAGCKVMDDGEWYIPSAAGLEKIVYTQGTGLEKFAELIVAECIGIVEPTNHHEAFAQGYMGGVDGLDLLYGKVKQIKKHFGVEE